ncbi:MAG TPA: hypothetical protein VGS57_21630 [Thermoanaerobaculia bacterium]|nr:hypothetical protein [Thermoanaerobaculia bacterium]
MQRERGLLSKITTELLSRYHLAPGESRALRRVVRARIASDDYRLLQSFSGRSSFATYLLVVVVRLVRELTAGWQVREVREERTDLVPEGPPRPAVATALAFLRALPPRDRILLRLRFGEQLPLSSLRGVMVAEQPELRRRVGELRRALLRKLTEAACEDRHTASLIAAAARLDLRPEGEPGPSRPSKGIGELPIDDEIDDSIDDQVPS